MNPPPPAPEVPRTCQLDPLIRLAMLMGPDHSIDKHDPCARCNSDREECGGRPRAEPPTFRRRRRLGGKPRTDMP